MRQGDVYAALRRLAKRLDDEGLDYAIIGGMAVVEHGSRRTTEDIDVLMRPETLESFRALYLGRGYLPAFAGAERAFRDTETGTRIEVVVTGDFPGDGKPKAVAFPDPAAVSCRGDEFTVVRLETLIDLKLASGLTAPHRLRDLAERLDPSVRAEYRRLWDTVQAGSPDRDDPAV